MGMQLDLSPQAVTVLEEVLRQELGSTREQIYKSEVAEYKASLKQREQVLESVLAQLRSAPA
jgi:hypothetical protein